MDLKNLMSLFVGKPGNMIKINESNFPPINQSIWQIAAFKDLRSLKDFSGDFKNNLLKAQIQNNTKYEENLFSLKIHLQIEFAAILSILLLFYLLLLWCFMISCHKFIFVRWRMWGDTGISTCWYDRLKHV